MADALQKQGSLDEAIAEYREVVGLKADWADAHLDLGNALAAKGDIDAAILEMEEAVRLRPEDAYAHASLCKALREKGDTNGSLAECRRALKLNPDANLLPWLHDVYGMLLQVDGDLDGAISEFSEAARLQPENPLAHFHVGSALYEKGRQKFPAAEEALREALRLDPNSADARLALGKLLHSECMQERFGLLDSAHSNDPVSFETAMTMPLIDCGKAVSEYRKALNLKPNWAEAHFQLAEALWWIGNAWREQALSEYGVACSLGQANHKFCEEYEYHRQKWDPKHHKRR